MEKNVKDQHLQERNDKKENLIILDISEKEVSEDIQVLEPNEELTTQKKRMLKTTVEEDDTAEDSEESETESDYDEDKERSFNVPQVIILTKEMTSKNTNNHVPKKTHTNKNNQVKAKTPMKKSPEKENKPTAAIKTKVVRTKVVSEVPKAGKAKATPQGEAENKKEERKKKKGDKVIRKSNKLRA
ncbi:uncharacterized protein LOC127130825 [Lathyrus oleraceus]|uniref:uncharacterized protein LOC127130825 n=1 Tax=Pisum sativum TaxID=3888 RepID=UPI0021D33D22|nr:uncharacterized protein LOC127130825 [Pisum sativum]